MYLSFLYQVRQMAAVTLSGLLHCDYLTMDEDMLVSWFPVIVCFIFRGVIGRGFCYPLTHLRF